MSESVEYFNLFATNQMNEESFKSKVNDLDDGDDGDDGSIDDKDTSTSDNHHITMPDIAKKALVYLMKQGVVLQSQKPQVFANVLQYQEMIARHLSEVYLSLIIDERQGVLFIARSDYQEQDISDDFGGEMSDEEDISSLIGRRVISVYDSLLLLILRK